jgi:hypothetical protein
MRQLILILLMLSAIEASEVWTLSTTETVHQIHAAGNTVVAWHGALLTTSNDAGRTFLPLHQPFAAPTDVQASIRAARATPQGGIMVVTTAGKLYLATQAGDWQDLGAAAGLTGVSVATIDGAGTIYAVTGAGTITALAPPLYQAARIGAGLPVMTTANGVVVRQGDTVALVSPQGTTPIKWQGDAEKLIQPFSLARATTTLNGMTFGTDGTNWAIQKNELVSYARITAQQVIAVASSRGTTYVLGVTDGRQGIWERNPQGWRVPREIERADLPTGITNFTVTDSTFLVVSPTGIARLDRDG